MPHLWAQKLRLQENEETPSEGTQHSCWQPAPPKPHCSSRAQLCSEGSGVRAAACAVFWGERPQHLLPPRALPLPQLSCSPVPAGTREWHQWPRRHQARAGRATYFLSPLYHSKTGAGTPAPSHRISPFPPSITPLDLSSWIVGATEKKIVK